MTLLDPLFTQTAQTAIVALAALAATGILAAAALRGWQGWLALKRDELGQARPADPVPSGAARIEMADLRERVRKLEAIAAGVDL